MTPPAFGRGRPDAQQVPCERCGFSRWVPIIYGFPADDMREASHRGEIELGGCVIEDGSPTRRCSVCGHLAGQPVRRLGKRWTE